MFPLSIEHSVVFDVDTAASTIELVESLTRQLNALKAERLTISGNTLTFEKTSIVPEIIHGLLSPISKGEIVVDEISGCVKYRLSFKMLAIQAAALLLLGFGFVLWLKLNINIFQGGLILLGGWLWLVGGNAFVTGVRFRGVVRRSIDYASQKQRDL